MKILGRIAIKDDGGVAGHRALRSGLSRFWLATAGAGPLFLQMIEVAECGAPVIATAKQRKFAGIVLFYGSVKPGIAKCFKFNAVANTISRLRLPQ